MTIRLSIGVAGSAAWRTVAMRFRSARIKFETHLLPAHQIPKPRGSLTLLVAQRTHRDIYKADDRSTFAPELCLRGK